MTSWTSGFSNASVSPTVDGRLEPAGHRRRQAVQRVGQRISEKRFDIDRREHLLGHPVGERRCDLGFGERVAGQRGDLVAVEQGHPGPDGDCTGQQQHHRQHAE